MNVWGLNTLLIVIIGSWRSVRVVPPWIWRQIQCKLRASYISNKSLNNKNPKLQTQPHLFCVLLSNCMLLQMQLHVFTDATTWCYRHIKIYFVPRPHHPSPSIPTTTTKLSFTDRGFSTTRFQLIEKLRYAKKLRIRVIFGWSCWIFTICLAPHRPGVPK